MDIKRRHLGEPRYSLLHVEAGAFIIYLAVGLVPGFHPKAMCRSESHEGEPVEVLLCGKLFDVVGEGVSESSAPEPRRDRQLMCVNAVGLFVFVLRRVSVSGDRIHQCLCIAILINFSLEVRLKENITGNIPVIATVRRAVPVAMGRSRYHSTYWSCSSATVESVGGTIKTTIPSGYSLSRSK